MSRTECALVAAAELGFLAAALGAYVVGQRWLTGTGLLLAGVAIVCLMHIVHARPARQSTDMSNQPDPAVYWIFFGTIILLGIIGMLARPPW